MSIRPVALPDGPRGTMARLRGDAHYALLESALAMPGQAEWSYIAGPSLATLYTDEDSTRLRRAGHEDVQWADPFEALQAVAAPAGRRVCVDGERLPGMNFTGGWVGLLGYDLARSVERLPTLARHDPPLPRSWWMAVDQVLAFHHASGRWWHCTARGPQDRWPWTTRDRPAVWTRTLARAAAPLGVAGAWSAGPRKLRTSRAEFEAGVQRIRNAIAAGEVLQVNLTRREEAAFSGDAWSLYEDLVAAHPAPFAAYLDGPGFTVASCSPERFLHLRGDEVQARPIKGTAARGRDAREDAAQRQWLADSQKDRAENLMIVDLMRNDLGRVAQTGSVQVSELFALEPYASVWQMVSTVRARLRADCGVAQLLRACWPPGSMTGAPKPRAMQMIEALEPVRRGWYAGALGYLDCGGDMDLAVLIRSAVVSDGRVMLQFGGGIVADSEPAAEWVETVAKGERLARVLDRGGDGSLSEAAVAPAPSRSG
ncbi:aminodeoxychorismate synthase component I [Piscinibacter sp.]|uniref:aminodeoxychorismate synthase component I n=1 Tax=Piscinibacter sp. TaxID=1903157 RepID=UPI002F40D60E